MRILQFVARPQRRGAEVFAHQLTGTLRRSGNAVSIAYLYDFRGDGSLPLHSDDLVLGANERHPSERLLGGNPWLVRRLIQLVGERQPDVIQLNGDRTVKYGSLLRRLMPTARWSVVYRNIGNPADWIRTAPRRMIFRALLSGVDGAIAISDSSLQAMRVLYPRLGNGAVIHNGIDPAALETSRSREDVRAELRTDVTAPVVLSVGNLSHEKRPDLLLEAFALVRSQDADAVLWVVGGGPLRGALEAQAEHLGIRSAVRFAGVRPDIGSLMAAADVFALTSDTEGIPAVVLEAGYQRLPVVATRVGGLPECILDGETGLLVERRDVEHIARALTQLLLDAARRKLMGEHARRHVASRFTMDTIAEQYLDYYRALVERRARRAASA